MLLKEVHKIDIEGEFLPGVHNFYRGVHPPFYGAATKLAISELEGLIDPDRAISVWEKAMSLK
ncbi:MAG: hypothetical protein N4A31_07190 [Rickettsiales bacterium]|jgi:aminoglycoside phosphotransferase (APT) family kinase protein|nr:hypothetical protein [Rickettsiales bacterium]